MRHKKTLVFLSPVPWIFHNRQIPLFADELSKSLNVIYFDNSKKFTVSFFEIIFKSKIRKDFTIYINRLFNKNNSLISKPIVISGIPLDLQLKFISLIASGTFGYLIWCCTSAFTESWRNLNGSWIYDFFDRYPDLDKKTADNEKWLLKNAKIVLVGSAYYKKFARLKKANRIVDIPIGYDLNNYLQEFPKASKKLTVGYQGGISDRLDFDLILESVNKNPDINFVFIGPMYLESKHALKKRLSPKEFLENLKSYPNVRILPFIKDTHKLARVISGWDIGWIPYNTKVAFNRYATPNKFYEYTAVGLPVVSTPILVLKDYPEFVTFIDNADDFRIAVKKLKTSNKINNIKFRKKFAIENNIDKKYKKVTDILNHIV